MATKEATKVITGEVRFSYAHVFEPVEDDKGNKKYSVSLVIPKSDKRTIKAIENAIEAAKKEGASAKFGGKIPAMLKLPLRDGDEERPDDEVYRNSYFVNATASEKFRPGLIYQNGQPIIDTTDFYSGCYGHASVSFYAFNTSGNKGIACGLNNIMKTRDGEPLSGTRAKAEDDFSELLEDDDMLD